METTGKEPASRRIYVLLIAILLLLNTFSVYLFIEQRNETTDLGQQRIALQREFRNLNDTLDLRSNQIEQLRGYNADLDSKVSSLQQDIATKQKELSKLAMSGQASRSELQRARSEIASYKEKLNALTAEVASLTEKNATLLAANTELTGQLETAKTFGITMTEQNALLSKKVAIGSLLPVSKLDVAAIRYRKNGKEVKVKKAKSAESLRIAFETGYNRVLDPGEVSLYVRIINPKGETIALQEQGSGTITAQDNSQLMYTKRADIDYDNTNKNVTVYWNNQITEPGTYKVELYQSGQVIARGEVQLT
ncbi:MAG: hypothetical protein U0T73_02265 [Chitinophagales bacterium]